MNLNLAKFILSCRAGVTILWGLLLFAYGSIPSTELSWIVVFTGSPGAAAAVLIVIGMGCLFAIHGLPRSVLSFSILLLLLPVVLIPAIGSIQQVIAQHYADLTPRPWQFILTGQSNTIAAGLIDLAAFVTLFWRTPDG